MIFEKKGQLLSQPFFYIFAILVIGLILIFGFKYAGKLFQTGCEVEVLDFVSDVQTKVNELSSLSYGSSYECAIVSAAGKSQNRCELVIPTGLNGFCFVDTTKGYNANNIIFPDTKQFVIGLGSDANRNLFFSNSKQSSCTAEPAFVNKLTTNGAVCIDARKNNQAFIIENTGNKVEIRKV